MWRWDFPGGGGIFTAGGGPAQGRRFIFQPAGKKKNRRVSAIFSARRGRILPAAGKITPPGDTPPSLYGLLYGLNINDDPLFLSKGVPSRYSEEGTAQK